MGKCLEKRVTCLILALTTVLSLSLSDVANVYAENPEALTTVDEFELMASTGDTISIGESCWQELSGNVLSPESYLVFNTNYTNIYYCVFWKQNLDEEWECVIPDTYVKCKSVESFNPEPEQFRIYETVSDWYQSGKLPGNGYIKVCLKSPDKNPDKEVYSPEGVSVEGLTVLDVPQNLTWEGTYSKPVISWDSVSDADKYIVSIYYFDDNNEKVYIKQDLELTDTQFSDFSIDSDHDFFFSVTAKSENSNMSSPTVEYNPPDFYQTYTIENMHIGNLLCEDCYICSGEGQRENPDYFYWNTFPESTVFEYKLIDESTGAIVHAGSDSEGTYYDENANPENKRAVYADIARYAAKDNTPYHMEIEGINRNGRTNSNKAVSDTFYSWGSSKVSIGKNENGLYPRITLGSGKFSGGIFTKPAYYYQWQVKEGDNWKNIENGSARELNPAEALATPEGSIVRVAVGAYDVIDGSRTDKPHYIGLLYSDEMLITGDTLATLDISQSPLRGTLELSAKVGGQPSWPKIYNCLIEAKYNFATDENGTEIESVPANQMYYEWYRVGETTPVKANIGAYNYSPNPQKDLGKSFYCVFRQANAPQRGGVVSSVIGPVTQYDFTAEPSVTNVKCGSLDVFGYGDGGANYEAAVTKKGDIPSFSNTDMAYCSCEQMQAIWKVSGLEPNTQYTVWVRFKGDAVTSPGTVSKDVTTINHEFSENIWEFDDIYHWKECNECGEKYQLSKHNYEDNKCKDCKYEAFKVEIDEDTYVYTGSGIKPKVKVTDSGYTLKEKTDYTVSYVNNVNASVSQKGSVIVTGKGNYSGKHTVYFAIKPIDIKDMELVSASTISQYNAKKPIVTVNPAITVNGKKLKKGTDYIICDSDTEEESNTVEGIADEETKKTFVIKGINNYSGFSKPFDVVITNKKPLSSLKFEKIPNQSFGVDLKTLRLKTGGEELPPQNSKDDENGYKYVYNGWNVLDGESGSMPTFGKVTAVVTAPDNSKYFGSIKISFNIVALNLTQADLEKGLQVDVSDCNFSPAGACPKPTVKYEGVTLRENVDYTLSYKNNKAVADASAAKAPTVTIKFKGNYKGSVSKTFNIAGLNISAVDVPDYVAKYTGKVIAPKFKVVVDKKTLAQGKDYDLIPVGDAENGLTETGVYKVSPSGGNGYRIEGKGNYSGTIYPKFVISALGDISTLAIDKIPDQKYTGKEIRPDLYSKKKALTGCTVEYADNTDLGTATVTLNGTGTDGYFGSKNVSFKIVGYNFKDYVINNNPKFKGFTFTYGDSAIVTDLSNSAIELTNPKAPEGANDNIKKMPSGMYSMNYDPANLVAGKYNFKLTSGCLWVTGNKTFTVTINPYDVTKDMQLEETDRRINVTVTDSVIYSVLGAKPKVAVTFDGDVLKEGTDYTLSYANNKAVAAVDAKKAPAVTVKFKGNFKGKYTAQYSITPRNISAGNITASAADVLLKGKAGDWKTKSIVVTDSGKKVSAKDYTISYRYKGENEELSLKESGISDRSVEVTVTGVGNYTGERKVTYNLGKYNLAKCKVKVLAEKKYIPGAYATLSYSDIEVTDPKNQTELLGWDDFVILEDSYTGNNKKGTASVTLRGVGDYAGSTLKVNFKITDRSLAK